MVQNAISIFFSSLISLCIFCHFSFNQAAAFLATTSAHCDQNDQIFIFTAINLFQISLLGALPFLAVGTIACFTLSIFCLVISFCFCLSQTVFTSIFPPFNAFISIFSTSVCICLPSSSLSLFVTLLCLFSFLTLLHVLFYFFVSLIALDVCFSLPKITLFLSLSLSLLHPFSYCNKLLDLNNK